MKNNVIRLFKKNYLQSDLEAVQSISKSAKEAAELLGCSYNVYKSWAKKYGIDIQAEFFVPKGAGQKKGQKHPFQGKHPLDRIIKNEFDKVNLNLFKDKLISSNFKEEKCEGCGFDEKRVLDGKIPLFVSFKDGNRKNFALENVRILCYNCAFLVGDFFRNANKVKKVKKETPDTEK